MKQSIASTIDSRRAAGRYLTFRVAQETYGIPVLAVQEILRKCPVTAVPQLPAHLLGVINLRGRVIPVMDLRLRLGFTKGDGGDRECLVVVHLEGASGIMAMGLLVDAVDEVVMVSADDICPPPEFGGGITSALLVGFARVKGQVKTLIDIDRLLHGDEIAILTKAA